MRYTVLKNGFNGIFRRMIIHDNFVKMPQDTKTADGFCLNDKSKKPPQVIQTLKGFFPALTDHVIFRGA